MVKIKQKHRSENRMEIVHVLDAFWHTLGALLGAQNGTKMETKTKTKLERQKGGSEGPKGGVSPMRRDPSMHSILLWHGNWNNWQKIANSTLSIKHGSSPLLRRGAPHSRGSASFHRPQTSRQETHLGSKHMDLPTG